MITEAKPQSPQNGAESLLLISQQYLSNGQPDQALDILDGLIRARPNHVSAIVLRAKALQFSGEFQSAASAYAEAIRILPEAESYLQRARCFRFMHLPEEALACLDVARITLGELFVLEKEASECEREIKFMNAKPSRGGSLANPNQEPESSYGFPGRLKAERSAGETTAEA